MADERESGVKHKARTLALADLPVSAVKMHHCVILEAAISRLSLQQTGHLTPGTHKCNFL
jgi:hypothetical protein